MRVRYLAAAAALQMRIIESGFASGASLPGTKILAAQLGFNQAAVVRACNLLIARGFLVRDGYKMRVGLLERKMQGTVEVIGYSHDFCRAASHILTDRGIQHRLTELSWLRHPSPESVLRKIMGEQPAAMIFQSTALESAAKSILSASDIPVVVCAEVLSQIRKSSAQVDVYRGSEDAVRHLYQLGHREIAHLGFVENMADQELAESYRMACLKLHLRWSANRLWTADVREEGVVREAVQEGIRNTPGVTALFCPTQAGIWVARHFNVPGMLSVVGFGLPLGEPPSRQLTMFAMAEPDCLALWSCTQVIAELQLRQAGLPSKPPVQAKFVPDFIPGDSTQALSVLARSETRPASAATDASDPAASWQKVYPALKGGRSRTWIQLDLSKLANHSMTRQHGWLGSEPLEHFPPGLRSIHGVPFQVLDENRNGGRSVVTFRSPHSLSSKGRELPTSVLIAMTGRSKAIYFLHGCGSAQPVPFAEYIIHYRNGSPNRIPLIPLGRSKRRALKKLGKLKPNLQDWWPEFPQGQMAHARPAAVFNAAEPGAYQRYLYSLEWNNPRPKEEISAIEARVNPKAGPALALIAVTALVEFASVPLGSKALRTGRGAKR